MPSLELSYNTNSHLQKEISEIEESDADDDWAYEDCVAERKWNYAFWLQKSIAEIYPLDDPYKAYVESYFKPGHTMTPDWEDHNLQSISDELSATAVKVVMDLHGNGVIESVFGKKIPIYIHGYEYTYEEIYMTAAANPKGTTDEWMAFNFYDPSKNIKK